jgi:N-acetylneuraminic acid mutarotase
MGGKLYVFGGEGGPGVIANCWSYDPKTDAWSPEPDMRTPRHGLAGVTLADSVYAIGGGIKESGGQVSAVVEALLTR